MHRDRAGCLGGYHGGEGVWLSMSNKLVECILGECYHRILCEEREHM